MNRNVPLMSNCLTSLLLLASISAATLGCSDHTFTSQQPSEGARTGILLLPSAPHDADDIGSLGSDAAAQPTDLGEYRRASSAASFRRTAVSRHPFRQSPLHSSLSHSSR
jgi:hypothetical protein